MSEDNLYVEASPEDLAELKAILYENVKDVDVVDSTETKTGEHGEPILIALVIALGGPVITREVMKTVRHWLDVRKTRAKLEVVKFAIERGASITPLSIEQLEQL